MLSLKKNVEFEKDMILLKCLQRLFVEEILVNYQKHECVLHAVYKNAFNIFTVELVKASRADFDEAVI